MLIKRDGERGVNSRGHISAMILRFCDLTSVVAMLYVHLEDLGTHSLSRCFQPLTTTSFDAHQGVVSQSQGKMQPGDRDGQFETRLRAMHCFSLFWSESGKFPSLRSVLFMLGVGRWPPFSPVILKLWRICFLLGKHRTRGQLSVCSGSARTPQRKPQP